MSKGVAQALEPSQNRTAFCSQSAKLQLIRARAAAEDTKGFHQTRLAREEKCVTGEQGTLCIATRAAESDKELWAASYLRAITFYAYPPERSFAGKLHQQQVCNEEFEQLQEQRNSRLTANDSNENSATIIATCARDELESAPQDLIIPEQTSNEGIVIGSLDVHAIRALPGEVLIGNSQRAAYLANVCVWSEAQRRGVGAFLIAEAREQARLWGADGLFVHMMAVNERARSFYGKLGFVVEKEESSNEAHYRGRCLDGVEGRARTILMRDSLL